MNIWQGKKILLRGVNLSDYDDYFHIEPSHTDTDGDRCGWTIYSPPGNESLKKRVEELSLQNPLGDEYFFIIENPEEEIAGNINVHDCDRKNGTFSYGLAIRTDYRKRGYARDAITTLLNVYFNEYNFRKVNIEVYDFNEASLALHRSMGFREEGCRRQNHFAQGRYCDEYLFGITREEYNG